MQVLTGTRREITVMGWREILEKNMKRANDSMECFRRFSEASDLEHLIEDCEKILENARQAKKPLTIWIITGSFDGTPPRRSRRQKGKEYEKS